MDDNNSVGGTMIYYLVQGNAIIQKIDTANDKGFVYLPVLSTESAMSLVNEVHLKTLASTMKLTPLEAIAAIGIADARKAVDLPAGDWLMPVAAVLK